MFKMHSDITESRQGGARSLRILIASCAYTGHWDTRRPGETTESIKSLGARGLLRCRNATAKLYRRA